MNEEFFDENGWLHAHKGERNAENAIMYTIMLNEFRPDPRIRAKVMDFIEHCHPDKRQTKYKLSLDNVNALCLAKERGIVSKGELLRAMDKTRIDMWLRPDNFYTWSKTLEFDSLAMLVFPLYAIALIYTSWKASDKKPRGEGKDRIYIEEPATNGKNQAFIRLRTHYNSFLDAVCSRLIAKNFGHNKGFFNKYFDKSQPLLSFTPDQYNFKRIEE